MDEVVIIAGVLLIIAVILVILIGSGVFDSTPTTVSRPPQTIIPSSTSVLPPTSTPIPFRGQNPNYEGSIRVDPTFPGIRAEISMWATNSPQKYTTILQLNGGSTSTVVWGINGIPQTTLINGQVNWRSPEFF